jgi:hypothetical protein
MPVQKAACSVILVPRGSDPGDPEVVELTDDRLPLR